MGTNIMFVRGETQGGTEESREALTANPDEIKLDDDSEEEEDDAGI
jgi:hypothetical protein